MNTQPCTSTYSTQSEDETVPLDNATYVHASYAQRGVYRIGGSALDELLQQLRDARGAEAVDEIQDALFLQGSSALEDLIFCARDTSERAAVRAAVLEVAAALDPERAKDCLVEALAADDERLRLTAVEGLSELLNDPDILKAVQARATDDSSEIVRETAAELLEL